MSENQQRLDQYLAAKYDLSRAFIQKLFRSGNIEYSSKKIKPATLITDIDTDGVIVNIPDPEIIDLKPENIDIKIIYEDSDLAVVYKPKGMVVHPSAGHSSGTLVNALMYHLKDLSGIGGQLRPGIVHRLDKDTEGLILIAKNDKAHNQLSKMFSERLIEKRYRALLSGIMSSDAGTIEKSLGRSVKNRKKIAVVEKGQGKPALTSYQKVKISGNNTLVDIQLHTGRTHQIRVHFASIGFPLVGDPVYQNRKKKGSGQLLIAYYLKLNHPVTGNELEFKLDLPSWAS